MPPTHGVLHFEILFEHHIKPAIVISFANIIFISKAHKVRFRNDTTTVSYWFISIIVRTWILRVYRRQNKLRYKMCEDRSRVSPCYREGISQPNILLRAVLAQYTIKFSYLGCVRLVMLFNRTRLIISNCSSIIYIFFHKKKK